MRASPSLLLLLLLVGCPAGAAPAMRAAIDGVDHGWFFYEAAPAEARRAAPAAESPAAPKPLSARWFREHLDRYRDAAIDHPSPENVRLYLYLQRYALDRSEGFARAAQLAVMRDPALDEAQRGPISGSAQVAAGPLARAARARVLATLANDTGLWFFFRSDCPYCHQQVAALAAFARTYAFAVLPISVDGLPLATGAYADFRADHGQARRLGIRATPTLVLVRRDGQVLRLAQGLQTLPELEERVLTLGHEAGWIDDADYDAARGITSSLLAADDGGADPLEPLQRMAEASPPSSTAEAIDDGGDRP